MDVDSDILGGRLHHSSASGFLWSLFTPLGLLFAIAASIAYYAVPWIRKRREVLFRKAIRRRHGIPDTDHRPFNVAYAAAMQKRTAGEASGRQRRVDTQGQAPIGTSSQTHFPSSDIQNPRHRTNHSDNLKAQPVIVLNTTRGPTHLMQKDVEGPGNHAVTGVTNSRGVGSSNSSQARAKHRLEEEFDLEDGNEPKKSRIDNDEFSEQEPYSNNEETDEGMDVDILDEVVENPKRGHKRSASQDDDEGISMSRSNRRKIRARRTSRNDSIERILDESMDDEDDVVELESVPRGKKRDRVEAGSTFGGDDSILEDEENPRSHRRRRTASHRKTSVVATRGQKRGRDVIDSMESDEGSELSSKRSARQKRGKKGSEDGYLSQDDGMISQDPLCKGRRIGEEWESNGVAYKVGPNGQRLRQALVKKARSLFPMPKDSNHPDRDANVQVFVETWLSDEEYQSAKDNHELAWQESPPMASSPTTSVTSSSPTVGKSLLWPSAGAPKDSPRRAIFRQTAASNAVLRVSPFQQPSSGASGRRISTVQSPAVVTPESPKPRIKSYSKWEKQDLEAAAMAKLREKAQTQLEVEKKAFTIAATPVVPALSAPTTATTSSTTKEEGKPVPPTDSKPPTPFSFSALAPAPTTQASTTVPTLAPTPSVASNSAPQEPLKAPLFQSPAAASQPTVEQNQPKPALSVPSFSLPKPPATQATPSLNSSPAPSPNLFAPNPAKEPTPGSSSFFPKPASSLAAPTPFSFTSATTKSFNTPGPSANTIPTITVTQAPSDDPSSAAGQPSAQKSTFAWGKPATSSTTTTPASMQPPAPPLFSFGAPSSTPSPFAPKPAEAVPAGSSPAPSLASRIGGIAPAATSTPPANNSLNTFGKPDISATSLPNAAPKSQGSSTASASIATPKFDFGFPKPIIAAVTTTPIATPAAEPAKPALSSFGFGPSQPVAPSPFAPANTATNGTSNPGSSNVTPPATIPAAEPAKPSSAFGFTSLQPAASSPFAASSSTTNGASTPAGANANPFAQQKDASSASKLSFTSTFGTTTNPSPFSATAASTSSSSTPTFGATTAASAKSPFTFGASNLSPAAQSVFGAKSMFAPSTTSASASSASPGSFSFTAPAPAAPAQSTQPASKPAFSFNFGVTNSSSSSSPFGAATNNGTAGAATAPAFGLNKPTTTGSTTVPSTFSFGTSASSGSNQEQQK